MQELKTVGKSVSRLDALEKVTGRAKFVSDVKLDRMLCAKVMRSPHAHAKMTNMDTSRAEKVPGVRAIITPKDMPAVPTAPFLADQYLLCQGNVVRCVGEPVAAVAADTAEIAEKAIHLIEVDYEVLPPVFDAEEAFDHTPVATVHADLPRYRVLGALPVNLVPDRPNVCQFYRIRKGDVARGFEQADVVVENKFTTARMQHSPLEPHGAIAWFDPETGLNVITTNQMLYELKGMLTKAFDLSPSKVRIISTYIGGGFGGKTGVRAEPIVALLAQRTGRPVSLFFTREEMSVFGGHRIPFTIHIKDGAKKDGTLTAREITAILAIGIYSDKGVLVTRKAPGGATGIYRLPNLKIDSFGVYTNLPLTGALRGFGCPEIEWAIEQQMDILAAKLKLDPVEIRRRNILYNGETDASGTPASSIGVKECLEEAVRWIDWGSSLASGTGPWKRGRGIAIGSKPTTPGSTSVVIVKVWQDGTIEVRHSATEMGQGIKTALAQIAAEEFGITLDRVKLVSGDTAVCPYDFGTVSSRSVSHVGNALMAACRDAKRQLFKMASARLGAFDLDTANGTIYVKEAPEKTIRIGELFTPLGTPLEGGEVIGRGSYTGPWVPEDPETGQSPRSCFDHSYIANAVELEVNEETGEVRILRTAVACDVGKAVNPQIVEGQIEGGNGMGIGSALYEEVLFDDRGVVTNTNYRDYKLPRSLDLPGPAESKAIIVEVPQREGPYGAKGVGELPLVATAPAIANAIYNATGVRIHDLPMSKEKVLDGIERLKSSNA